MSEHDHPVDPQRVAAAQARLVDAQEAARLAGLLGLLADAVRVPVVYALHLVDELCVGDIALALGATQDSVGYGLRVLRTAGLVSTRKEGRVVYYRLSDGFPDPLRQHCLRALVELSRRVEQQD